MRRLCSIQVLFPSPNNLCLWNCEIISTLSRFIVKSLQCSPKMILFVQFSVPLGLICIAEQKSLIWKHWHIEGLRRTQREKNACHTSRFCESQISFYVNFKRKSIRINNKLLRELQSNQIISTNKFPFPFSIIAIYKNDFLLLVCCRPNFKFFLLLNHIEISYKFKTFLCLLCESEEAKKR